jgi:hypothetical protein
VELYLELGRVYREGLHDPDRARFAWEAALKIFFAPGNLTVDQQKDLKLTLEALLVNLARLEDETGNYPHAIDLLRAAQKISPAPDALQKQIDDIQKKIAAAQKSLLPTFP